MRAAALHAQEFARSGVDQSGDKQEVPADPVIFTKSPSSLADPFQKIAASADPTQTVDYEGELGVVIARRCKDVKRDAALDHVFAYTIVNDVTARAVQQRHKQWFLGKSLDTFCPVGPWLVTRDEFGVPDEQELATYVNGERRQLAKLRDMGFPHITRGDRASVRSARGSVKLFLPSSMSLGCRINLISRGPSGDAPNSSPP